VAWTNPALVTRPVFGQSISFLVLVLDLVSTLNSLEFICGLLQVIKVIKLKMPHRVHIIIFKNFNSFIGFINFINFVY